MGNIISPEGFVYGGFDESNHGDFPEYFCLVLSGNKKDAVKLSNTVGKAKTEFGLKNISRRVSRRGHTFLQVEKRDYDRIIPYKFIGHIIASLTEDFLPNDLETFFLYVDGKLESSPKIYARDLVADIYDLNKNQIKICAGGKFDKKYSIVNMADGMARYYFKRKFSARDLSKNKNRRELQAFE